MILQMILVNNLTIQIIYTLLTLITFASIENLQMKREISFQWKFKYTQQSIRILYYLFHVNF